MLMILRISCPVLMILWTEGLSAGGTFTCQLTLPVVWRLRFMYLGGRSSGSAPPVAPSSQQCLSCAPCCMSLTASLARLIPFIRGIPVMFRSSSRWEDLRRPYCLDLIFSYLFGRCECVQLESSSEGFNVVKLSSPGSQDAVLFSSI